MKSYSELLKIPTFSERLEYLKILDNNVKSPRNISRKFYKTDSWKIIRKQIIDRDLGFDLGVIGVYIEGPMIVHHINPIGEFDILNITDKVLDPENLITTSIDTHNKIHYNTISNEEWQERRPGDTKLW